MCVQESGSYRVLLRACVGGRGVYLCMCACMPFLLCMPVSGNKLPARTRSHTVSGRRPQAAAGQGARRNSDRDCLTMVTGRRKAHCVRLDPSSDVGLRARVLEFQLSAGSRAVGSDWRRAPVLRQSLPNPELATRTRFGQ